ncbi:MAG: hypothetical protein U0Q12_03665 [Vicinamibacterales bacterium]
MVNAPAVQTRPVDRLVAIVRAEYREMPGLNLTFDQAKRLWGIEQQTCHQVLDALMSEGFLRRTPRGSYAKLD